MTTHTPGPWHRTLPTAMTCHACGNRHTYDASAVGIYSDQTRESNGVATVYGRTPNEAEANARLIAASPDLLQALTGLLEFVASEHVFGFGECPICDESNDNDHAPDCWLEQRIEAARAALERAKA